jgi:IS5 family transposase
MLRIYCLQHWFNLSDPAVEEALYDSSAMRAFVGIDLGREPVPDETTVCKFRHLLEAHHLGRALFEQVARHLQARGLKVASGTIVDATIINAPSSTKNQAGERDPEMKQTRKGNQWYFGMKAHIGVASQDQAHSLRGGHACQRARQPGTGAPAARGGNTGLGRQCLRRANPGDPTCGPPRARFHAGQG